MVGPEIPRRIFLFLCHGCVRLTFFQNRDTFWLVSILLSVLIRSWKPQFDFPGSRPFYLIYQKWSARKYPWRHYSRICYYHKLPKIALDCKDFFAGGGGLFTGVYAIRHIRVIHIPEQGQSNAPSTRIAGTSCKSQSKNQILWWRNQLACIHMRLFRPCTGHTTKIKRVWCQTQ